MLHAHEAGALDALSDDDVAGIVDSWTCFCEVTSALLSGPGDLSVAPQLLAPISALCDHSLYSLACDHFLHSLEESFKNNAVTKFWMHVDAYFDDPTAELTEAPGSSTQDMLSKALEIICSEKVFQEKCIWVLVHAFQCSEDNISNGKKKLEIFSSSLMPRYQLMVSAVLLSTLHFRFPEILQIFFKRKLEELNFMMAATYEDNEYQINNDDLMKQSKSSDGNSDMDIDGLNCIAPGSRSNALIRNIGKVVHDLRSLGFTSITENAYYTAIVSLLKSKIYELAGDDYRVPVLASIKEWIQVVPLKFLHALLTYLGDSIEVDSDTSDLKSPLASPPSFPGIAVPSKALIRWHLRLEYFAYETLQDLRIQKLFDIIVDYPDSSPALEDLKQCLEYTGQHSKLVESFVSSLRYRLLTAGASTNDILHQYVSTIKALRTIDPSGVFLEAVGEPIRDYLRARKDTIKCIVTMLTDGLGGNTSGTGSTGDCLLEELNREAENLDNAGRDDEISSDDKQAWKNAQSWEPDPVEADPRKGSRNRRTVDILGLVVSIIGSKEQLVNEYRIMLAEKLLNKSDYEIDSEIRTLELLKIHFGEGSMQKCEIMLNDLIDSKRINANIKASLSKSSMSGGDEEVSLDIFDATIISSNFWPPIQLEDHSIPAEVDEMLGNYAKRFNEIKTPRKLLWKKSLGTVKLELQFEDQNVQFTVAPVYAAIIKQFHNRTSWTSKNLSAVLGMPVDLLNKRISFWINKGIVKETQGAEEDDNVFTVVSSIDDINRTNTDKEHPDGYTIAEDDGERSVASVEEQLRKEMTVYEKFIIGMLTNFGSMTLDRIHNTLKMFCTAEPAYDKSPQQLLSFLSGLISDEKLELRDGSYYLKK